MKLPAKISPAPRHPGRQLNFIFAPKAKGYESIGQMLEDRHQQEDEAKAKRNREVEAYNLFTHKNWLRRAAELLMPLLLTFEREDRDVEFCPRGERIHNRPDLTPNDKALPFIQLGPGGALFVNQDDRTRLQVMVAEFNGDADCWEQVLDGNGDPYIFCLHFNPDGDLPPEYQQINGEELINLAEWVQKSLLCIAALNPTAP